jgi:hypothetical protein
LEWEIPLKTNLWLNMLAHRKKIKQKPVLIGVSFGGILVQEISILMLENNIIKRKSNLGIPQKAENS